MKEPDAPTPTDSLPVGFKNETNRTVDSILYRRELSGDFRRLRR